MPKRDLRDFRGMLADIFREVSPAVRAGMAAGIALGALAAFLVLRQVPEEPGQLTRAVERRFTYPLLIYTGIGLMAAGGFVGCLAGVLIEALAGAFRKRPGKPRPPAQTELRGWKPARRGG